MIEWRKSLDQHLFMGYQTELENGVEVMEDNRIRTHGFLIMYGGNAKTMAMEAGLAGNGGF